MRFIGGRMHWLHYFLHNMYERSLPRTFAASFFDLVAVALYLPGSRLPQFAANISFSLL